MFPQLPRKKIKLNCIIQLLNRRDYCGHNPPGVPVPAGQAAAGRAGEVSAASDQPTHDRHGALLR